MRKTKEKGITLIALIITIIVMIILAGVAINGLIGENGIFKATVTSAEKYEMERAREKLDLTLGSARIRKSKK